MGSGSASRAVRAGGTGERTSSRAAFLAFSAASFSAAFFAASCFFFSFSSCLRRFFISLLDSGSPLALRGGARSDQRLSDRPRVNTAKTHLRRGVLSVL